MRVFLGRYVKLTEKVCNVCFHFDISTLDQRWPLYNEHHSKKRGLFVFSVCAKSLQLYPTLCNPVGCSPPGSSVCGISQERILEWVAISFSRRSSPPRDRTHVSWDSCTGRLILYYWATREAQNLLPSTFDFPDQPWGKWGLSPWFYMWWNCNSASLFSQQRRWG